MFISHEFILVISILFLIKQQTQFFILFNNFILFIQYIQHISNYFNFLTNLSTKQSFIIVLLVKVEKLSVSAS